MKSVQLREMDVVPAPLLPSPNAGLASELRALLGPLGESRLRHLMDGRDVHAPGLLAGSGVVTGGDRSPRVRFLAGPLHQDGATGRWLGPVLPESSPWRATYVELDHLAHRDCTDCAAVWLRASATTTGFALEEVEVMPGVGALVAAPATGTASAPATAPAPALAGLAGEGALRSA